MLKLQQRKRKQVNMDADLWIWNSAGPGAEHGWEAVRSCGVATGPSSSGGWQSVTVNDQLTEANQSRSDLHFAAKILQFYHRNVCGKRPLMVFGAAFPSKPGCHQHVARVVGGLVWLCLRNSWRGHTEFPDVWQKSSEVGYQRLLPQASQGQPGDGEPGEPQDSVSLGEAMFKPHRAGMRWDVAFSAGKPTWAHQSHPSSITKVPQTGTTELSSDQHLVVTPSAFRWHVLHLPLPFVLLQLYS